MATDRSDNTLEIRIHGRDYHVACEPADREALLAAVSFLDRRMQEIADKSRGATTERIAVMAALNIAHEFLSFRASHAEGFDTNAAKRRILGMEAQIDAVLGGAREARGPQDGLF